MKPALSPLERELYGAKACESEIATLRKGIAACEAQRNAHLVEAQRLRALKEQK